MDIITVIPWFVLGNSIYLFIAMARRFWKNDYVAWEWMVVSGFLAAFAAAIIVLRRGPAGGLIAEEWTWVCLVLFILLFLAPALLLRFMQHCQDQHSYIIAWILATMALVLHPFPSSYHAWQLGRFNVLMGSGKLDLAVEMLRETPQPTDMQSLIRYMGMLRLLWRWDDIIRIVECMPPKQQQEPAITAYYLYALPELERVGDLFTAARNMMTAHPNLGPLRYYFYLNPCAHSGRLDLILSMLNGPLQHVAPPFKELWLATTLQRAGRHLEARVVLEKMKKYPSFLVQRSARQRLQEPLQQAHLASDEDAHVVLSQIEKDLRDDEYYIERAASRAEEALSRPDGVASLLDSEGPKEGDAAAFEAHRAAAQAAAQQSADQEVDALHAARRQYRPWATWAIGVSLVLVFMLDNFLGAPAEPNSLSQALQTWIRGFIPAGMTSDFNHPFYQMGVYSYMHIIHREEYWRLVTPLFLHINLLHLGFNTMGLLSFGPELERVLGRVRFLIVYFACGLAGTGAMTLMIHEGWMQPLFMLGASGSVMGLVGATAWILLHRSVWGNQAMARENLGQIGLLLGLQTAFDLSNPQVSFTAHSLGALTGFLVTIPLYRPRRMEAPPPSEAATNTRAVTGTTS
ncbi:MAG: rhomboid family intramembrane serine protease [Candidatus Methylacidiphilales bacterium]|nr:rhomboid family intramembrane serine protease [Candidatus Methylacidiphilales bacterium]